MSSLRNGKDDLKEISRFFFFLKASRLEIGWSNEAELVSQVAGFYKGLESIVYVFPFNPVFHCAHPGL